MIKNKGNSIVSLLVIVAVVLIGIIYYTSNKINPKAGAFTQDGASSTDPTVDKFLTVSGLLRIARSPDGFILWDDFTVATTSPVRGVLTNSGDTALMCDGASAFILASSTGFAPSFRFVLGTTTSPTAYSANLLASTTVATTTQTVSRGPLWNFILERNASITLSVGDTVAAIASSTHYGNWAGQFGIHCWSLGE